MRVFITNGIGGSGKDTFYDFIKSYSEIFPNKVLMKFSVIDPIKRLVIENGIKKGEEKTDEYRTLLYELKKALDSYSDYSYNMTIETVKIQEKGIEQYKEKELIAFIDAREKKDIDRLKKDFSVKTILVRRPDTNKWTNPADSGDNFNGADYDYIIYNYGTIDDLKNMAEKFFNEVIMEGE